MRSVENKLLNIPLGMGMNESGGQRSGATALYSAVNCRVRSVGTLQKRNGTTTITGTTNISSGTEHCMVSGGGVVRPTERAAFITTLGEQITTGTTAGDAFNFDGTAQNFRGCFSSVLPLRSYAANAGTDPFNDLGASAPAIAATSNGYIATAYVKQSDTVAITVRAPDRSVVYTSSVAIGATGVAQARLVVSGSDLIVLWQDGLDIVGQTLTISAGIVTAGAVSTVATLVNPGAWDTSSYDATNWFLVYQSNAANVSVAKMVGLSIALTNVLVLNYSYLSIWADPTYGRLWVGLYVDVAAVKSQQFTVLNTNLGVVVPLTEIDTNLTGAANTGDATPPLFGPCYSGVTPTSAMCVLSVTTGTPETRKMYALLVAADGTISWNSRYVCPNVIPISKPDAMQRVWCTFGLEDNVTPYATLLLRFPDAGRVTGAVGTGRIIVEASTGEYPNQGLRGPIAAASYAFHAPGLADDRYAMLIPIVIATETGADTLVQPTIQAQIFEYTTSSVEPHRAVIVSGSALLVAGQPTELPEKREKLLGSSMGGVELGFGHRPAIIDTTVEAGFGFVAAGSYAYKAVLQWADALGRRQLSAPSEPVLVTADTDLNRIKIHVAGPFDVGQRPPYSSLGSSPTLLLYRTTDGGSNYQLLPLDGAQLTGTHDHGTFEFSDTISDETLASNEFIYTDGNVLPNVLAPTCRFVCAAEERIWCGGLWDPTILEASKVRVPSEPTNFTGHPSHQVVLPEECTGIAYMDGQIVAFAAASIYLIGGDGPNDQGAGAFLPPRLLTRGIGCIDYKSILETQEGVFFQSGLGIYLLPRGFGAPQYVGMPALDTLANRPVVLSSAITAVNDQTFLRFLLADSGQEYGGSVLTYDLDTAQWFVDSYAAEGAGLGGFCEIGQGPIGALLARFDLTSSASPIWQESATAFSDAGAADIGASTFIARTVQTTWVYPFALGGWGRVNKALLSMSHEYLGSIDNNETQVSLEIETDDVSVSETKTWAVRGSPLNDSSYRGFDITVRTCTGLRATITESLMALAGARGPKFIGLTLEIEPDGGMRMLTAAER